MARRTVQLWLATVIAAGIICAPAGAGRRAYTGERRDIATSLGVEPRCISIRISTVNERWAAIHATNRDGCFQADGVVVMQRVSAHRWRMRYQGPADSWTPCSDIPRRVPRAVAYNLNVCGHAP